MTRMSISVERKEPSASCYLHRQHKRTIKTKQPQLTLNGDQEFNKNDEKSVRK